MNYIKNYKVLISHGNSVLRKEALDIINAGLQLADPSMATHKLISFDRSSETLYISGKEIKLGENVNIYVIGAGKATFPIAKALDEILGSRITEGLIVCKDGQEGVLDNIEIRQASHPIPNKNSVTAALDILEIAKKAKAGDIIFACITGGSSALLSLPVPEISLADKQKVNKLLLTCGANIIEINAVRKHLSLIKGGQLAKIISPDVLLFNLTVSDVIGDPLDYITDPTVPDTSTFSDAKYTLDKYNLWDRIPVSVRQYLKNPPLERETPKSLNGHLINNHILVNSDAACVGAALHAKKLGFETIILSTMFEGESRELGRTFSSIAKEVFIKSRPVSIPCAFIAGGETTVTLNEEEGIGGPNQEFVLGAALEISGLQDVVIAGIDTDGTDGPTHYAGGIIDEHSLIRAYKIGIDIFTSLQSHNTTDLLTKMKDAIITGNTGTNVNDLKVMLLR